MVDNGNGREHQPLSNWRRDESDESADPMRRNDSDIETKWSVQLVTTSPTDSTLNCPICLSLFKDPHLTNCCGSHFCQICIERVSNSPEQACPVCRSEEFNIFPNLEKKREVLLKEVYCINQSHGCPWTGSLGQLYDKHLQNECQFVMKACLYKCGLLFLAQDIVVHEAQCPNMPLEVFVQKLKEEQVHMMGVVNSLVKQVSSLREENKSVRRELDIMRDVHYQEITKLLEEQENVQLQLEEGRGRADTLSREYTRLVNKFDELSVDLQSLQENRDPSSVQANSLTHLESQLNQMTMTCTAIPPLMLSLLDFYDYKTRGVWWQSQPFYSHPCGYKFRLEVKPAGNGNGSGTHISVYVHIMKGEFDDKLRWPLSAYVHFRLIDHLPGQNHFDSKVFFSSDNEASVRVKDGRVTGTGRGYSQFIPLTQLVSSSSQFLENDSLDLEITKVDFK